MTSAEAPPPALCWKGPAELAAPAEDDADAMSLSLIDGGMLESAEIIDRVRSATGNGKPPKKMGTRYAGKREDETRTNNVVDALILQ